MTFTFTFPFIVASVLLVAGCGGGAADEGAPDAAADTDPITMGFFYVKKRACPDCHQSPDPVDGLLSGSSVARPLGTKIYAANLTPDPETGLGEWSADKIVRAIHLGIDKDDGPLCASMPRFDRMRDEESYAIAAYLKSLPPVHRAITPSICPPIKPHPDAGAPDADAGGD